MPDDSPTGKLRTVDYVRPEDDSGEDIPVVRPARKRKRGEADAEDSRSFAKAAVSKIDAFARERLGAGLSDEAKDFFAQEMSGQFDRFARRMREDRTTERHAPASTVVVQRASAAWITAAILGCSLFVGALWATWDKIRSVERQQHEDSQYATVVANWLVTDAETNYERAKNLDSMLRIIASQIGADVSNVPPPTRHPPPTPVQRKHNDYLISQGE